MEHEDSDREGNMMVINRKRPIIWVLSGPSDLLNNSAFL